MHIKKCLTDEFVAKFKGKEIGHESYDILLREDADVFCADTGKLLIRFRKNQLDPKMIRRAYQAMTGRVPTTDNRFTTGGINEKALAQLEAKGLQRGKIHQRYYANPVHSAMLGYFGANPRFPFCRTSAFTRDYKDKHDAVTPLLERVTELYEQLCPEHYAKQKKVWDETVDAFKIPNTVFTTVTVNENFRTRVHTDSGDFAEGFGNLVVVHLGKVSGGYTILPQYRIAVDARALDVLFMNVHEWHGNAPYELSDGASRISFVMYYREDMFDCKSVPEELKKARKFLETNLDADEES